MKYSVNLFEQRKLFESIIRSGTRTHYPHRQLVSPQSPKTDAHKRSWMAYPKKPPKSTPVNIPTAHPNPQQSPILPRIPLALNTCPNPSLPQQILCATFSKHPSSQSVSEIYLRPSDLSGPTKPQSHLS